VLFRSADVIDPEVGDGQRLSNRYFRRLTIHAVDEIGRNLRDPALQGVLDGSQRSLGSVPAPQEAQPFCIQSLHADTHAHDSSVSELSSLVASKARRVCLQSDFGVRIEGVQGSYRTQHLCNVL